MKGTQATTEEQWQNPATMALEDVIRAGAQRMLQAAIEMEVAEHIGRLSGVTDAAGHRLVVRNGWKPERAIQTGIGSVRVQQPRVQDHRPGAAFTSRILPPYMRRVPSVDALIPALYLHGISTGDFGEALSAILGPQRVLIGEDDKDTGKRLTDAFSEASYAVDCACTGPHLLEKTIMHRPDVILADLILSNMNGDAVERAPPATGQPEHPHTFSDLPDCRKGTNCSRSTPHPRRLPRQVRGSSGVVSPCC